MGNKLRLGPRVAVVGSVNMDLVLQTARSPSKGESLIGKDYRFIPGGKGANQAIAANRLGADVYLGARVGSDPHGRTLKALLKQEGVATSAVVMDRNAPTGLSVIVIESDGHNRILVFPGANMSARLNVLPLFDVPCDAFMVNLEIPAVSVIETCRLAIRRRIPLVLDCGPAQPFPLEKIRGIEILSPNETETFQLTGMRCGSIRAAEVAAVQLAKRSAARWVVIKLGRRGALVYGDGKTRHVPGHQVKVVDTTAAGDAFTAAMLVRYLETQDILESVAYANVAGALAVMKLGAYPALPRRRQIERFRRLLGGETHS